MEVEAAKAEVDFDDYNYDYDPYSTYYSNYTEVHAIHTAPAPPDYVHISVTVILMLAGVAVNGVATAKLAKEEKTNFVFLLKTVAKLAFAVFTLALMNVIAEIFCGYQTTLFPFLFAYLFYPIGVLVTILLQMVLVLMGIDILRNTSDPKASPCSYSLSCTITIAALMSIPSWLTFSVIQTGNGTYRLTVRDTLLNSLGQSVSVWMALLPPTVALLVLVAVVAFRRRKGKVREDSE